MAERLKNSKIAGMVRNTRVSRVRKYQKGLAGSEEEADEPDYQPPARGVVRQNSEGIALTGVALTPTALSSPAANSIKDSESRGSQDQTPNPKPQAPNPKPEALNP